MVTDRVEFQEQNYAPRIVSQPSPWSQWPAVPQCDPDPDWDAGEPHGNWVQFSVVVSDPNVDQVLNQRILINGDARRTNLPVKIPTTGERERTSLDYCLPVEYFDQPCNHVVVLIADDFPLSGDIGLEPQETETYARGDWYILGPSGQSPASCAFFDAGTLP
ncbi:MAG: hypothetical protein QM778_23330 [Myxococcales bacterium]